MFIEKHVLVKKMFTNMALLQQAWVKKTVKTHRLCKKEKVPGEVVCKEGYADCVLVHETTYHYWFLWKKVQM